ncbi:MAG: TlpA family protein disulfide reductase, partial [Gammaproteobacteria bacterium]|nr:TlpA family protein disulfide reductase [Gammaproteobacteria bacterium]
HFWASWCGPCRKEMPTIQAIFPEFKDSGLEIVLVNTAESEDTVFNFIGIVAPDLNPLMDIDGLATERWQPRGLPATFFIDPKGKLRYLALGGRPWDKPEYLAFLKNLIKK